MKQKKRSPAPISFVLVIALLFSLFSPVAVYSAEGRDMSNELKGPFDSHGEITSEEPIAKVTQNGEEIPNGGTIDFTKEFKVEIAFSVPVEGDYPDESNVGIYVVGNDVAYFNLNLPEELKLNTPDYVLKSPEGITIGAVTFESGNAKITFDDALNAREDFAVSKVWATLEMSMKYDKAKAPEAGEVKVIQILDKSFTIEVPPLEQSITASKKGTLDIKNKQVHWMVDVNSFLKNRDDGVSTTPVALDGYEFYDDLSTVGEYVEDSFKIGTSNDGSDAVPVTPDATDPALSYTFPAGSGYSGKQYLFFSTVIKDSLFNTTTEQSIKNTAKITTGGATVLEASDTVKFKMNWISKDGTLVSGSEGSDSSYDSTQRLIRWTIHANQSGATITGGRIIDLLPDGLQFVSASAIYRDVNLGGIPGSWSPPVEMTMGAGVTETIEGTRQKLTLDVSEGLAQGKEVEITLVTKVTSTAEQEKTQTFTNSAKLAGTGVPGGTTESNNVTVNIGFNPIAKNAIAYNRSSHELTWGVTVNTKNQSYGGDLRVLDLLVYGPTGSFNVNDFASFSTGSGITEVTYADLQKLTPNYNQKFASFTSNSTVDYTIYTLMKDTVPVADLLVVTGKPGPGIDPTTSHTFSFKTLVTNPDIYAANATTSVSNRAALFNMHRLINSDDAAQNCESRMLKKNMLQRTNAAAFEKNGLLTDANSSAIGSEFGFDYTSKSAIFRIYVNENNLLNATDDVTTVNGVTMGAFTVKDVLPAGWEFQKLRGEDFLIYEGSGWPGQATGSPIPGAAYSDFMTVDGPGLPEGTTGESITFTFNKLTKPYVIFVKAGPTEGTIADYFSKNQSITKTNNVTMSNVHYSAGKAPSATQNIKITSQLLDKRLSAPGNGTATWTVVYNPYGLEHPGVYMEDTLPNGIDFPMDNTGKILPGSITVTALTVNADGTTSDAGSVAVDDTMVQYNNTTRILKFTIPDSQKAYRLTYLTYMTGELNTTLTNHVKLYSGGSESAGSAASTTIIDSDVNAGLLLGGIIQLKKVDGIGNPLSGAEFTVFALDGTTVIRKGETKADGTLRLMGILAGTYILEETKAPAGGYSLEGVKHALVVTTSGSGLSTSIDGKTGSESNRLTVKNFKTDDIGSLKIEKKVLGTAPELNKNFAFKIRFYPGGGSEDTVNLYQYTDNSGNLKGSIHSGDTISLKHEEMALFNNLSTGLKYTIEETNYSSDGYTTLFKIDAGSSTEGRIAQGTINADKQDAIQFINTRNKPGDLMIAKVVERKEAKDESSYRFTVTLSDSRTYGYTISDGTSGTINGTASIWLKDSESVTFAGLPEGTTYTVTEDDYSGDGYVTTVSSIRGTVSSRSVSGTILTDEILIDEFTNIRPGNLELRKIVGGNDAEAGKLFEFEVELSDTVNTYTYTGSTSGSIVSGKATIWLGHDDHILIGKLSKGTTFTVTETDYSGERYRTTVKLDDGSVIDGLSTAGIIDTDTTHAAVFTNTRNSSGGGGGGQPPITTKPGITTEPGITTDPGITTNPGITTPEAVYGSVTVVKVDGADSSRTLAGAVFQLFDENGVLLRTSSPTGSNGVVSFGNLETGVKYYLKELTSPDGYQPSGSTYYFVLSKGAGNSDVSVTYRNAKQGETNIISIDPEDIPEGFIIIEDEIPAGSADLDDTPKTGGNPITINSLVLLMLLSGMGLLISGVLRRRKTQS